MLENKEISVVVPLYNEEGNVRQLHAKILSACQELKKSFAKLPAVLKKYDQFLKERPVEVAAEENIKHEPKQTKLF